MSADTAPNANPPPQPAPVRLTEDPILDAITDREIYVKDQRKYIKLVVRWHFVILFLAVACVGAFVYLYYFLDRGDSGTQPDDTSLANTMIIVLAAAYSVTFSLLMGMYKFFHSEIARAQQVKVAFHRIRVAGEMATPGFQSEVRTSLTEKAFAFPESRRRRWGREATHPGLLPKS